MKHIYWIAGASLFLSACSNNKNPSESANVSNGKAAIEMPSNSGGKDDYVAMREELTFTPEQNATFEKKLTERNEAFKQWEAGPKGQQFEQIRKQISAARAARNTAKVTQLEAEEKPLREERDALRASLRRDFDRVLTLDQQKQWAARNLNRKLLLAYNRISLTEAQKQQVHSICVAIANESVNKDTYKTDPYLLLGKSARDKAMQKSNSDVLTAAQRARIATTQPNRVARR
jgi:hypothetical protein